LEKKDIAADHIAAADDTLLNRCNQLIQQLFFVAPVFFQQVFIRLFVQFGTRDKFLQVFFNNQRLRDSIGFYFRVAQAIPKKRN